MSVRGHQIGIKAIVFPSILTGNIYNVFISIHRHIVRKERTVLLEYPLKL